MTSPQRWLLAIRPKTLGISVTPVLVGNSLAWSVSGFIDWVAAVATLLAASLIQMGTNLHNDALDFERGADTDERLGPKRATAEGWFGVEEVKRAARGCFALAFLTGCYLASIGGSAAKLAEHHIKKVEVLEYAELGMEAIWKIEVENFPAFIVIDDKGNDFFKELNLG